MDNIVIIPARYASSRYHGKPLVRLLDKPMILWVAELSAKAVGQDKVYIATDDRRIAQAVEQSGYQAIMTSDKALTGTDRLAEAAEIIDADIYLNVQGDEPLVDPADIIKIRDAKLEHMDEVINGFCWISDGEQPENRNIPKVVTNEINQLVYMSRLALPGFKEAKCAPDRYKKQVCIYAFTHDELAGFRKFGRKSKLEKSEDIEILRFLELNKRIRMVETQPGSLAVDTPEDVPNVEAALARAHGL